MLGCLSGLPQPCRQWSRMMRMGALNLTSALRVAFALVLMPLLSIPAAATDCWGCDGSAAAPAQCHVAPPPQHPCCSAHQNDESGCRHDPQWAISTALQPVPQPEASSRSSLSCKAGEPGWRNTGQRLSSGCAFQRVNPPPRPGQESGLYYLFAILRT